jgi:hypothetical protein
MNKKTCAAAMAVFLFISASSIVAQQSPTPSPASPAPAPASSDKSATMPRGFRGIELGMGMEETKKLLEADGLYDYRGDPDVSLLRRPNEALIEVSGLSYVHRAFFQFYEDKLFVIIIVMNQAKLDHYSIFTQLSGKYGKPASLSPSESIWSDGTTRMSLERPLSVKYIDMAIFEKLRTEGKALESIEDITRKDFLGQF